MLYSQCLLWGAAKSLIADEQRLEKEKFEARILLFREDKRLCFSSERVRNNIKLHFLLRTFKDD